MILGKNERRIRLSEAKAIFLLRYIAKHGLSRAEAAARLNMTRSEVNGILDRAEQRRIRANIAGF